MYDSIVIGCGAAGMTAALNILRNGKTVLILEKEQIGGQIANSPKVENFPSIKAISGMDFSMQLFDQITDESCRLLLNQKTEEVTKSAIKRIIELNSKENFIENLTKLLKTTLSLGIDFSNLVDE